VTVGVAVSYCLTILPRVVGLRAAILTLALAGCTGRPRSAERRDPGALGAGGAGLTQLAEAPAARRVPAGDHVSRPFA
jgi:hypothetical protein